MGSISRDEFHQSAIPFDKNRIGAAAVYCSDGRLGPHVDELLFHTLNLPRYDRLVIPGGAACLAGHFSAYREEEGVAEQLRFLLTVHEVRRVILIAHQDCAYYTQWLHVPTQQLEARQLEDLAKAVRHVKRFSIDVDVSGYFARHHGELISFERLDL